MWFTGLTPGTGMYILTGCMLMYSLRSATACGGTGASILTAGGVIPIIMTGLGAAGMVSAGASDGVPPGGDLTIGIIRPIGQALAIGVAIIIGEMRIQRAGLTEGCALRIVATGR